MSTQGLLHLLRNDANLLQMFVDTYIDTDGKCSFFLKWNIKGQNHQGIYRLNEQPSVLFGIKKTTGLITSNMCKAFKSKLFDTSLIRNIFAN